MTTTDATIKVLGAQKVWTPRRRDGRRRLFAQRIGRVDANQHTAAGHYMDDLYMWCFHKILPIA